MRKTWIWTALFLVLIAGGSYGLYIYLQPPRLPDQVLYGNGHIEGTDIRVSAEVAGRVVETNLTEGVTVDAGAQIAKLDDVDLVLRKQRADAEVEALRRTREKVVRETEVARHHLATANRDLARYRELSERGTSPTQRVEQVEDAFREAQGHAAVLAAEVGAVEARIEAAEQDLHLIANQLAKTRIAAPSAGTVLARAIENGEFVQVGQTVAILADLTRLELKVYIPEKHIGKVTLGAVARVRIDAFPDRYFDARVARVDQQAQFTPRDIHMPEERTLMVFGVTLDLANPEGLLKPGMPADAWILWRPDAGWPAQLFVPT